MYQRYLSMLDRAGLGQCVALAVASTGAWYLLYKLAELVGGTGGALPADWNEFPGWLLLWSTGTVYAVLVLFRYLDPANLPWRPVVIGFGGALSYWIGWQYVLALSPTQSETLNAATAGVITAGFLGYLVIRLGTLRFARGPFAALYVAGALGGATIGWATPGNEPVFVAGHAAWQVLTCVAFFYSPRSALPAAAAAGKWGIVGGRQRGCESYCEDAESQGAWSGFRGALSSGQYVAAATLASGPGGAQRTIRSSIRGGWRCRFWTATIHVDGEGFVVERRTNRVAYPSDAGAVDVVRLNATGVPCDASVPRLANAIVGASRPFRPSSSTIRPPRPRPNGRLAKGRPWQT